MKADCCQGPDLMQAPAKHPACMVQVSEQGFGTGKNRSARRVEVLIQRHVNGVKKCSVLLNRAIGVDGFQEYPRAIEMQSDFSLTCPTRDAGQLIEVKTFSGTPPYW